MAKQMIGHRKFLAYESGLIVGSVLHYLTNSDSAWFYIIVMTGLLYGFNVSSKLISFKKY